MYSSKPGRHNGQYNTGIETPFYSASFMQHACVRADVDGVRTYT